MQLSKTAIAMVTLLVTSPAFGSIMKIDLTPTDVDGAGSTFATRPTVDSSGFFTNAYDVVTGVDFNTAPDGVLSEGGTVGTQYASLGVLMNDIRITGSIYGGNNYGAGFATEDNKAQIFSFAEGVAAVGIINTSPDFDLVQFFSGINGTGDLLFEFNDGGNFDQDRFVGGYTTNGANTIRSFIVSNATGDLELDELVFARNSPVPEPQTVVVWSLLGLAGAAFYRRRLRRSQA